MKGNQMIQGIDVVFLHTREKDLQRWYAEVLGLELKHQDGNWSEFKTWSRTRFAVEHVLESPSNVENQAIMISFRVEDIHQAVKTLVDRGVRFHPSPEKTIFEVGPSLVATFQDPAGNWMQLSQSKE